MKLSWGKETDEFQVKNPASLTVTRAKTDTLSGIPESTTLRKFLFPLAVFYFPIDTAAQFLRKITPSVFLILCVIKGAFDDDYGIRIWSKSFVANLLCR